jgi:hypothetical protein
MVRAVRSSSFSSLSFFCSFSFRHSLPQEEAESIPAQDRAQGVSGCYSPSWAVAVVDMEVEVALAVAEALEVEVAMAVASPVEVVETAEEEGAQAGAGDL